MTSLLLFYELTPTSNAVAAVILGVVAWPSIVYRRKHNRRISLLYLLVISLARLSLWWNRPKTLDSPWAVVMFIAVNASAIALCTAVHRLSRYHPLAKFPGPVLFKLTNIRLMLSVASGYRYFEVEELHRRYGNIVRIGPTKLSIISHTALHPLYKSARCMDKSESYLLGHAKDKGLFFMTGREEHGERRAIWAPAFSTAMMDKHQPTLEHSITQLTECMISRKDDAGVIDLGVCFQHWSFDFMGHLVFGSCNSFDMMHKGDPSNLVRGGQLAMVNFETFGEVPWLFKILWYLPQTGSLHALHDFAASMTRKRRDAGAPDVPDVSTFLLGEDGANEGTQLNDEELAIDTLFAIQAGSDTTSGILTFVFFFLLANPSALAKLQVEVDAAFPDTDAPLDPATLSALPFLNAVLKEGLRLGTPFGGLARVVSEGGAMLEGVYVPEGTVVSVPVYALHVSETHFWPEPKKFLPERWLPGGLGPGSICEEAAFIPFSFGPFGCLGKNLAMRELLAVTARLALTFDMRLPPKFDPEEFLRSVMSMKTTIFQKPLEAVIELRNKANSETR